MLREGYRLQSCQVSRRRSDVVLIIPRAPVGPRRAWRADASDPLLRRSFHATGQPAAFLIRVSSLVVWLQLDASCFRPVLARGWHRARPNLLIRSYRRGPGHIRRTKLTRMWWLPRMAIGRVGCCTQLLYGMTCGSQNAVKPRLTSACYLYTSAVEVQGWYAAAKSWYKAQRSDRRRGKFVINVPPPTIVVTPAPAPPPAPLTSWARFRNIVKTVGPALISLAAIIIALAAFLNQRSANIDQRRTEQENAASAAAAQQRQLAERVSFLQSRVGITDSSSYGTVEVVNASISPVTIVIFAVSAIAIEKPAGPSKSFNALLFLNNMPACSVGFPNVAATLQSIADKEMGKKIQLSNIGFQINAMYFTDRYGIGWKDSIYGSLSTVPTAGDYGLPSANYGLISALTVDFKSTVSCS